MILRISAGFLAGVLALLATALYLSDHYTAEQQRLAAAGDNQGAMEASKTAVRLDPFDTDALEAQALLLRQQEKYDGAARALRSAIERDPNNYLPHLELANLQFVRNDVDAAVEGYREVLRLNPNASAASSALAQALIRTGDLEGAKREYERLEENKEISYQGLYNLGRIKVRTGEPLEGLKDIRRAKRRLQGDTLGPEGPLGERRQRLVEFMDLAIADALVVEGRYAEAGEILSESPSEQAPGLLSLLNSDPEAYREQVLNSDIY